MGTRRTVRTLPLHMPNKVWDNTLKISLNTDFTILNKLCEVFPSHREMCEDYFRQHLLPRMVVRLSHAHVDTPKFQFKQLLPDGETALFTLPPNSSQFLKVIRSLQRNDRIRRSLPRSSLPAQMLVLRATVPWSPRGPQDHRRLCLHSWTMPSYYRHPENRAFQYPFALWGMKRTWKDSSLRSSSGDAWYGVLVRWGPHAKGSFVRENQDNSNFTRGFRPNFRYNTMECTLEG